MQHSTPITTDSISTNLGATSKKRKRSKNPEPSSWACNVRKLKHQRGEAYINRRGKFVPEKSVRNTKDCHKSCVFKCSEHVSDVDRDNIFKAFYSLSGNEKKHFILNTTERNVTKQMRTQGNELHESKRKYSFKYFFIIRGVKHIVCKKFYLGTLSISQKPVYNVHLGKSDMNIPKPDGRGLSEASAHSLSEEVKDRVRRHIMSFNTVDCKPIVHCSLKKQYLEPSLNFKKMYKLYLAQSNKDNVEAVKESMYRKILKNEFNLDFKKIKVEEVLCSRCKGPVKKKKG